LALPATPAAPPRPPVHRPALTQSRAIDLFPSAALQRLPVLVSNPAAGSEWSATAAGQGWLIKSVSAQIAQGLTQSPQPLLTVADPGGHVVFESFGATGAQSASTTARYSWAPGLNLSALAGATPNIHANAPLPHELFLPSGYTIGSTTLGIGGGTQWQNIVVWIVQSG
jgi:hypothetical protein